MPTEQPLRLVQWTTGNVSRQAVKGVLERPDMVHVGVYAYSADKVGKDLGELCGLGVDLGAKATDDIDEIIALRPDCVLYMPLHPDVDHLEALLRAGINVATTAHFMTGRAYGEEARRRLQAAALAGGASLFGSGVNPGYAQYLAAVSSSVCRTVNHVRVLESFDIGTWAGDANQDELGWGRPQGDPGHAEAVEHATVPFGDTCEALAALLGLELDDVRCDVEFAHATRDLDIKGRDVRAGTVAGICARWIGSKDGHDAVETTVRWTISPDIAPRWDIAMAYQVQVTGYPNVTLRAEVLPEFGTMSMEEMVGMGSVLTAMPVVNAVPAVVAAPPGIVGYQDLPTVVGRLTPAPAGAAAPARPTTPFTRQSTLRDLATTRTGRVLGAVIRSQTKRIATDDDEARTLADMAGYMSVEKLVTSSGGKLPWGVADAILDLANGEPGRIVRRVGAAGRSAVEGLRPRR